MRNYGQATASVIGFSMKEAVRRAMNDILRERRDFKTEDKVTSYAPGKADFVTSADKAAQASYLKVLRDGFPTYGIVAEEDELSIPSTHADHDIYFTVDPLDGTKAYIRRQSSGIGTMLSLVCDNEVIAAYVGDPIARELFGYRPDSSKTHRITDMDDCVELKINATLPLGKQMAYLRDPPEGKFSPAVQKMLQGGEGRLLRGYEIFGGSIGIFMARLWKGEVGMAIFSQQIATPWDHCPVYGISRHLGFEFLLLKSIDGKPTLTEWNDSISKRPVSTGGHELIVIHSSRRAELEAFLAR